MVVVTNLSHTCVSVGLIRRFKSGVSFCAKKRKILETKRYKSCFFVEVGSKTEKEYKKQKNKLLLARKKTKI